MGRYAITAQFQPFSFQERIAPLKLYKEEYDKVNEGLALLGEEANAYSRYIDPNSESGKALAAYNEQLNQVANDLSANGLKAVSRNTLYNLRRNYNSTIKGINDAAKGLATMQEQYRALAMKDPTLMIGKMPTVDDLLKNPNAVPYTISGASLYEQAATTGASTDFRSPEEVQEAILQVAQANGIDALEDPSKAIAMIQKGINDGYNTRRAKLADKQADYELKDYYDQLKQQRSYKYNNSLIWSRAAAQKSVNTHKAGLTGGKGTAVSNGRGGVDYIRHFNGTIYTRGDKTYAYDKDFGNAQKDEATSARKDSRAKVINYDNLSYEHKLQALNNIGVNTSDFTDEAEVDEAMIRYAPYLANYVYGEYVDPKGKDSEFWMSGIGVLRDTYGSEGEEGALDENKI